MIIDLHVHTSAYSPCSKLDPEEAVRAAKSLGLDGICFTEHGRVWPASELERLSARWDFPVFSGIEVETREGHMLVFGLEEDQPGLITAAELREKVDRAGGAVIYAHPFRGFLLFGFSDLRMTVREACRRPVFKLLHAVEAFSGKSTRNENNLALEVCKTLSIAGVGGSDSHSAGDLGRCVTFFDDRIRSTADLVDKLKKGECRGEYRK
ncbi:MAG: PHP domain-containing protein [Peptococcaceae bacterium]|nr:PHP domain-containing protein [Peptococcaceae bacterium]